MKSYEFLLTGLILVLLACNSNDDEIRPGNCSAPPIPSALDYIPLAVGNYWVYDLYFFNHPDSIGEFLRNDTSRVTAIENINGQDYFKIERSKDSPRSKLLYLRDSIGFLVNEKGNILFTRELLGEHYFSYEVGNPDIPLGEVKVKTNFVLVNQEVPLGNFDCLEKQNDLIFYEPDQQDKNKTFYDYIYPGIGEIKGQLPFASNSAFFEYRLVEYQLE